MKKIISFLLVAIGMLAMTNVGYGKDSPPKTEQTAKFKIDVPALDVLVIFYETQKAPVYSFVKNDVAIGNLSITDINVGKAPLYFDTGTGSYGELIPTTTAVKLTPNLYFDACGGYNLKLNTYNKIWSSCIIRSVKIKPDKNLSHNLIREIKKE